MIALVAPNNADFNAALLKWSKEVVPQAALVIQKHAAQNLLEKICAGNPVLTGWSRSNWIVTINHPTEILNDYATFTSVDPVARGARVIGGLAQPYQVIYLQNNVHYIIDLENGTSRKAPYGFVASALAEETTDLRAGLT